MDTLLHHWRALPTFRIFLAVFLTFALAMPIKAEQREVKEIQRDTPVDFVKEILPILKQNCVACHHAKESEGGLNLESYANLVKGGDSGAGVVAKNPNDSLLFTRANGSVDELMPPEDNDVGAKPLTPEQLGIIKLWIAQGALAGEVAKHKTIAWQPIPETIKTVYAADISYDGQFVAAGHGNRVAIYDMATAEEVGRLIDPNLETESGPGVADVDLIQSLAFSPDGNRIATGGYRSVRIWRKTLLPTDTPAANAGGLVAANSNGTIAMVNAIGDIEIHRQQQKLVASGHTETITGLALTANHLVSCDRSGKTIVWDCTNGKQIASDDLSTPLKRIACKDDGKLFAMIDSQRKVHLRRLDGSTLVSVDLAAAAKIADANDVAFSKTALFIATDTGVTVINAANGQPIRQIQHGGAVDAIALSPDESKLATAGRDGKVMLWNTNDGQVIVVAEGSPQSKLLVTTAKRNVDRQKSAVARLTAKVATLEKAVTKEDEVIKKATELRDKAKKEFDENQKKRDAAAALLAKTKATVDQATAELAKSEQTTKTADAALIEANALTTSLKQKLDAKTTALVKAQQIAQKLKQEADAMQAEVTKATEAANKAKAEIDAAKKAAATAKATIDKSTKDAATQTTALKAAEEVRTKSETNLTNRNQTLDNAKQARERAVAAVPAQKLIVATATRRSEAFEQELAAIQKRVSNPARSACLDVAFSPDGSKVATAHIDQSARVYRASDGAPLLSLSAQHSHSGIVFIENGKLCSFSQTGRSSVRSLKSTWQLERTIGNPADSPISDRVTAIDFRHDGLTVAVGSGPPSRYGDVKIFAVDSGSLVRDFGEVLSDTVLGLRFSPDGNMLAASGADKTVRLLDVATNKLIRSFEGHTHHVLAVAWQDNGQTIASTSADQNIKVWDVESGEQRKTIQGFGKEVTAIAFVQQTNQVVSACADGQVRLHSTPDGKSIRSFNASGDFLYCVAVSDDGKTLIAGGESGVLRFWNLADGKLLHEIK